MVQPGWRITKRMKKLLISLAAVALFAGCQDRTGTGGTGSSSDTTAGSSWSRNKAKDTNAISPRTIDTNSSSSSSTKSSN